ncbi:long-chain-fatty-acid--CoA ligase [Brachymonas sp. G13]|uniref:long-chain-fatty-acid--CoA ligase n=1 Tax=Brachymonas TaxID=28219 RepID=UPI001697FFC7|nr:long-chain-fatty-acid--CoA ligase [Brachymonas sp. J145]MEE1652474.1 long-chain-fatty-acid--CoA ligase [Brachymonas sp. J145]NLX15919.1 long-chain-fatty-acid--CoA ligase [Ramlibacter sp.]
MSAFTDSRPWLKQYPEGVPADVDLNRYSSLVQLLNESFVRHADKPAYTMMGRDMTYGELDRASRSLAAYLQQLPGMQAGDRVAVMMPNILQYPIAVAAILRAGLVLVNVNPLYTARELEHQLKDSGAKAIIIIENFAHTLEQCLSHTDVRHIVLASMGDRMGGLKGALVNFVVRKVKKMVPSFQLPNVVRFNDAVSRHAPTALREVTPGPEDLAALQYTGGTTGVAKGAMLLHRNILANVLQCGAWYQPGLARRQLHHQIGFVCALPLYHIFAFTVNMMLCTEMGGKNILLPNPRDLDAVLKELQKHVFHSFPGVNTLFNGLAHHADFNKVDWSHLRVTVGGGMAVQRAVAKDWYEKTNCPICEGYGLSETSPVASCNPVTNPEFTGSIGVPVPNTWMKLVDEDGHDVEELGERGEIAIKGPQVMAGYWQRPEETARSMTPDGYLLTGDIGVVDEKGYFTIVDRKKDMILVSGFNVYPNEVEDVVALLPAVQECAVIGVPDENSGEAVKLFVVLRPGQTLTEKEIKAHCRENLTRYKQPRQIEFRDALPKTPIGKILRRALRDEELAKQA